MSTPQPADYDPRIEKCPVCHDGSLTSYDADFRGHRIDRCRGCGTRVMNPQYSDDFLTRFYSDYVGDGRGRGHKCLPRVRQINKTRSLALLAEHLPPGAGRRLLMVGCGDGVELGLAKSLGWQPEGHDISPETTQRVAEEYNVPVHCGDFTRLARPSSYFDAVFADQVVEHLKNPGEYLLKIHTLLRSGGVVFLGQPNIGSVANRLKTIASRYKLRGRRRRGNHYASKHHIVYFTPNSMRSVLVRHGFKVLLVRASLKPARHPWQAVYGGLTFLDSGFLAIARRP